MKKSLLAAAVTAMLSPVEMSWAQQPQAEQNCASRSFTRRLNIYQGYEVGDDQRVLFRLCAPQADAVTAELRGDVKAADANVELSKDAMGYWTGTTDKAIPSGLHRYSYVVDGLHVTDTNNLYLEQSINSVRSLIEIADDTTAYYSYNKDIPHGSVNIVEYWSESLGVKRRARVYTPPGYHKSNKPLPVLYLVHGGGGSDDVWTSTGRAHYILDNLLAEGKAKEMLIVMPEAHTPIVEGINIRFNTRFRDDLINELIPYIDANYRTIAKPDMRAMAGLSMGSGHTMNFGLPRSDVFRYIGSFSMGIGGSRTGMAADPAVAEEYKKTHDAGLKRSAKEMKLVYFAFGKDDPWNYTVAPTLAMYDEYNIPHIYRETEGAHTWLVWREYLVDFLPRIF